MIRLIILLLLMVTGWISLWLPARDLTPQEIDKKFFKRNFLQIDEVFGLPTLMVDETRVYIVDVKQCRVFIFDKKNGKKIAVSGNRGEGPSEFLYINGFYCDEKAIYICSPNKVTVFSKDGRLLKEHRINTILSGYMCIPFGQNYLYEHRIYEKNGTSFYFAYSLLDQNLKMKKTFFKSNFFFPAPKDKSKEVLSPYRECRKGIIYKDRFYLGFTDRGFYIAVFDISGNLLYKIEKNYDKIPLNGESRKTILNQMKQNDPENFDNFMSKNELVLQDYLPAYSTFYIYNDQIIVFKYPRPGVRGPVDIVLLGLKGNIIAEKTILLGNFPLRLNNPKTNSFYNGKIYFPGDIDNFTLAEFSLDKFIEFFFGGEKAK